MERQSLRIGVLVVVSVLIAILLASALNSRLSLTNSALAENSATYWEENSGRASGLPQGIAQRNYLPIILLNGPASIGCVTGVNGVAANGVLGIAQCNINVTVALTATGIITSASGVGLQATNLSGLNNTAGLYGRQGNGSGAVNAAAGVWGDSYSSRGVVGSSNTDTGVYGISTSGVGVSGASDTSMGIYGSSNSSTGVSGLSNSSYGVSGSSAGSAGVYGTNTASGNYGYVGSSTYGVLGYSSSAFGVEGNTIGGDGVAGIAVNGLGVSGSSTNGSGVVGTSANGFALEALGDATQTRYKSGWAKAMIAVFPGAGSNMTACYNSQQATPNSTVPCGFTVVGASGDYTITFDFEVNDRFFSMTPYYDLGGGITPVIWSFPSTNQMRIKTFDYLNNVVNSAYFLIVY